MNRKIFIKHRVVLAGLFFIFLPAAYTQGLFESDSVLPLTLTGNIRDLLKDRSEDPQLQPLSVSYVNYDGQLFTIAASAKTRGHFRKLKENCAYPPLLLQFHPGDTLQASIFKEQKKLKLVMPCKEDKYIIYEWLVYKLYNLVTPKSFRARLVQLSLDDTRSQKKLETFYGILLEDENQMAKRNKSVPIDSRVKPEAVDQYDYLIMSVFQYMIGNTDWGVQYRQNIKLIAVDSTQPLTPVPYDFDQSGIVNTPYAAPAEELKMSSVRERRYRGYCLEDMKKFDTAILKFNQLRPAIYKLYGNCSLLDARYRKSTLQFLDDFYATLNNPVALQKEFGYPCRKNSTGNVIIKGYKED